MANEIAVEYLENIGIYEIAIAAVSFVTGLLLGAIVWGRSRRQMLELEDELALLRARTGSSVLDSETTISSDSLSARRGPAQRGPADMGPADKELRAVEPSLVADEEQNKVLKGEQDSLNDDEGKEVFVKGEDRVGYSEETKVQSRIWPRKSARTKTDRSEIVNELSSEISKIKKTLEKSSIDVDSLKEYLDSTDVSVRSASNRLDKILTVLDPNGQPNVLGQNLTADENPQAGNSISLGDAPEKG